MTENTFEVDFRKRFEDYDHSISPGESNGDFTITFKETSKIIFVRTELPEVREYIKEPAPFYNARAAEIFRFSLNDPSVIPDYYAFIFRNNLTGKNEYLIIETAELLARLAKIPEKPDRNGYYELLMWALPDDGIFIANSVSAEGEWYLLGSGLWKGGDWDFSGYLNRWDPFY